jgi:outer membrane protein
MSAEQKEKLMRDIDQKTKALNRDTEDAQAELDQEQSKIMQELGQRIYAVIDKYSKDKGYSLILDVSSQQTPVLFASNDIDITSDIVKLYDQNSPAAGTSSGTATHAAPAAPKPTSAAPPKPSAPAPVKKTP